MEKDASEHVQERIRSLFLMDDVRIMQLLESIQFGLGYLIVGFASGVALDYSMPSFDETTPTGTLFLEVALQCLLLIVLVFYIRKVVKIMPFLFVLNHKTYKPYQASEYGGEVMIAIALLGAQFNLIKKLDLLSRRFYLWLYNEEKIVGQSLGI